jgi:hypothetical protein
VKRVTKSITIDVEAWEALEDKNKSEICDKALKTAAGMASGGVTPQRIDEALDEVEEANKELTEVEDELKELESARRVKELLRDEKREELWELLDSEVQPHLHSDEKPTEIEQELGRFGVGLLYASTYVETYLDNGWDKERTVNQVQKDMIDDDEGFYLRDEAVRWLADCVARSRDTE